MSFLDRLVDGLLDVAVQDDPAVTPKQRAVQKDDGTHTGFFVACFLDPSAAAALAQPGGEAPEDLHVTLCYVPEWPTDAREEAIAALTGLARAMAPLSGVVSGTGRFQATASSDGNDVLIGLPDVPGLAGLRHAVVTTLAAAGIPQTSEHGWTPHVTLAYIAPDLTEAPSIPRHVPIQLSALTIRAGDAPAIILPLAGDYVSKADADDRALATAWVQKLGPRGDSAGARHLLTAAATLADAAETTLPGRGPMVYGVGADPTADGLALTTLAGRQSTEAAVITTLALESKLILSPTGTGLVAEIAHFVAAPQVPDAAVRGAWHGHLAACKAMGVTSFRCGPGAATRGTLARATKAFADTIPADAYYTIVTQPDACPVCTAIADTANTERRSGRIGFPLRDVMAQFDALADAADDGVLPDELEAVPFPRLDDVIDAGVRELTASGWSLPGFHPGCRCQAVLVG